MSARLYVKVNDDHIYGVESVKVLLEEMEKAFNSKLDVAFGIHGYGVEFNYDGVFLYPYNKEVGLKNSIIYNHDEFDRCYSASEMMDKLQKHGLAVIDVLKEISAENKEILISDGVNMHDYSINDLLNQCIKNSDEKSLGSGFKINVLQPNIKELFSLPEDITYISAEIIYWSKNATQLCLQEDVQIGICNLCVLDVTENEDYTLPYSFMMDIQGHMKKIVEENFPLCLESAKNSDGVVSLSSTLLLNNPKKMEGYLKLYNTGNGITTDDGVYISASSQTLAKEIECLVQKNSHAEFLTQG